MTVSEQIRRLASEGLTTSEIARQLGIRYQHAYNVLRDADVAQSRQRTRSSREAKHEIQKPPLSVDVLTNAGFVLSSRWLLSPDGELRCEQALPKEVGVYAFAMGSSALYVGVATMGLARRLYFYAKPGISQKTSQRLNGLLREELAHTNAIEIYTVTPPDLEWNGLPVHGSAGLELGLIKNYALPWNVRSGGS